MRLTVAQALVRFLADQYIERDGEQQRLIAGCFGIFGHGNVAGVGQALLEAEVDDPERRLPLPSWRRNEQAMVHAAVGYARHEQPAADAGLHAPHRARARPTWSPARRWPRSTGCRCCCCPATRSRPGSADAGAAGARGPVAPATCPSTTLPAGVALLRPGLAARSSCPPALLGAMRVLTDPAETGAVTLALPQDVQAEAYDWPEELFAERVWHVAPAAARARGARPGGRADPRRAARPLIVAGGGVDLLRARPTRCARFAEATGIPVAETQAGKGSLPLRPPAVASARSARPARPRPTRWPARPTW